MLHLHDRPYGFHLQLGFRVAAVPIRLRPVPHLSFRIIHPAALKFSLALHLAFVALSNALSPLYPPA